MPHIFSVRELTTAVKDVVESQFPFVWVRGQVTNLARPASGHIYFSLRDDEALLNVVWFRQNQWLGAESGVHPLTGEVVEDGPMKLEDGLEVLCAGRLTVYGPRGQYQLVAELVQEQGVGELALRFEALKRELQAKGYFDADRKMEPPLHPQKVALVTAPTGAAIRDFLRIASDRGWGCEIRIYPTLVQGDAAPGQIAGALEKVCEDGWADVAVLIRGGGSLEDLWAFNTVEVADALFLSTVPVVSGVGHEVDTTISDLVADVRAATPSHAAQLLWPERRELVQRVDGAELDLEAAWNVFIEDKERELAALEKGLAWLSPARSLDRLSENFLREARRLDLAMDRFLSERQARLGRNVRRLSCLPGASFWAARDGELDNAASRLAYAGEALLSGKAAELENFLLRLEALDPEKPLERGYSLVTVCKTGKFLRSPDEVRPGDELDIRVQKGRVAAVVAEGEK